MVGAGPRRIAWHVSGRETCHPLHPLSPRVCIYPDTTPHDGPPTRSIYDRALHATSFMQRYHPGIYVPARLLALSVMEDEQARLAQSQAGDDLVGQTIAMVSYGAATLVLGVGGPMRTNVYVTVLEHRGRRRLRPRLPSPRKRRLCNWWRIATKHPAF